MELKKNNKIMIKVIINYLSSYSQAQICLSVLSACTREEHGWYRKGNLLNRRAST